MVKSERWVILAKISFFVLVALSPGKVCTEYLPGEDEEFCDYDELDDAQRDDAETEPSFCQEVILNDNPELYNQDDHNILAALATSMLNKTYPTRINSLQSFATFDEMPYPVPTGASSFFMVLITVIFTWYFNKFIHWMLRRTAKTLDLFPLTDQFPKVYIYMLQQSRRESKLSREVRNTWSWLATFYLLKPSDPSVNTEEIFRSAGWNDFELPRDVWGIIRAVLRVNAADRSEVNKNPNRGKSRMRRVSSETNAISRRTVLASKVASKARTSAEDIIVRQKQEKKRLMMLRKLLRKKESSHPKENSSSDSDSDEFSSVRDAAVELTLHPTTNASNFDVEKQMPRQENKHR